MIQKINNKSYYTVCSQKNLSCHRDNPKQQNEKKLGFSTFKKIKILFQL